MHIHNTRALLIQRILDGLKDDYLDVLEKNAERVKSYPVWKAIQQRRKNIKLEKLGVIDKSYTEPKLATWIRLGAHVGTDVLCIESVGRMLESFISKYNGAQNIETFDYAHIRCNSVDITSGDYKCEAFTDIGTEGSHFVRFTAGCDIMGRHYWRVTLYYATNRIFGEAKFDDEQQAIQATMEVIKDECLV